MSLIIICLDGDWFDDVYHASIEFSLIDSTIFSDEVHLTPFILSTSGIEAVEVSSDVNLPSFTSLILNDIVEIAIDEIVVSV